MKKLTGQDFYKWRIKHGLTQKQAAEMVGASIAAVQSWEQGLRNPSRQVALLVNRLTSEDFPDNTGSAGHRPIGIRAHSRTAIDPKKDK